MKDKPKEKAAAIRAQLKYPSIEAFVQRYAQNISKYGVFFKTAKPKPVGTTVKFELKIADDTTVLRGMGEVSWIRETEQAGAPAGMGIKFQKLDSNSRDTVKKILVYKKNSVMGPSRYSDAPPPLDGFNTKEAEEKARLEKEQKAKKEAEEKARLEKEQKAKKEAEEKARLEKEQKAKKEAEEKARLEKEQKAKKEAEEKARLEKEQKAKKEAEEKARLEEEERARKAQRAKEKLEEEKRSGAKIEADEEEIDDIVAAFDSIQMPEDVTNEPSPVPVQPIESMSDDTVDADTVETNLDEALFADALESEDSKERSSIADLLEESEKSEVLPDNFNAESLFIDEEPTDLDDLVEDPGEFQLGESSPADKDGINLFGTASSDTLATPMIDALPEDSVVEELFDEDLTEESADDLFDDNISDAESTLDNSPFVSTQSAYDEDENEAPLETEDYIIEEIDEDVELIEDIEELEDDLSDEFNEAGNFFDDVPVNRPSDGFDNLVNEYSKGTIEPQPRPEPLLANNTVDHALDDIFQGNITHSTERPKSDREQQLDRISQLPETLPDDALPASLAEIVKRKSLAPPQVTQSPTIPSAPIPSASTARHVSSANADVPGQQNQWGSPQVGMPGQQNQWGSPNTGMPGQQSQWGSPNAGMPGQQSQWGNTQGNEFDDEDDEFDKKKGFFGKLFGK